MNYRGNHCGRDPFNSYWSRHIPLLTVFDVEQCHRLLKSRFNRSKTNAKLILSELDQWIKQQVATIPSQSRWLVTRHQSMDNYSKRYGFKTMNLIDSNNHSMSLRLRTLSSVLKQLNSGKVPVLFTEQKPPSRLLQNLSRQIRIPLISTPIIVDGLAPGGNTVSTSTRNTCIIVEALNGSCDRETGILLNKR